MENGGHPGEKINASKNDDDERKIFIGGLSWETTVKDIKDYFGKYGEVLDATLKTDPMTGRSRGFGFVLFSETATVDKILNARHSLHGRNIDPKRAKARGGREPILKVFVGGLDPTVPESEIREYFERYGKVTEIDLPFDKQKNQRRAFCFVTFESEAIVDKCCERAKQDIGGKKVDIKKATPKNDQQGWGGGYGGGGWGGGYGGPPGGRGGFGGGRGGRGRGRGGYNQGWGGDQGWGGGYDNYYGNQGYSDGYDGYGGYGHQGGYDDYNYGGGYYGNQGGWGGGYDSYNYGGDGGYGGGYDYSDWGGGYDGNMGYNKSKGRGGGAGPSGYHPYSR